MGERRGDPRHLLEELEHWKPFIADAEASLRHRQCPHGFHHPAGPHSCDGCWCEGERDRSDYGWPHDTTPETGRG